jgi:hypothetical protein
MHTTCTRVLARGPDRVLRGQARRLVELVHHVPVRRQRQPRVMAELARDVHDRATLVDQQARERVLALDILEYLFVPPLSKPIVQARLYSGIDRRDAVFRTATSKATGTGAPLPGAAARLILFEFKTYDDLDIGKDATNQTRNYMTKPMGRLAVICSNKLPNDAAHRKINTIFGNDGTEILFLTPNELIEMLHIKERGEDPSDLIVDLVEQFYIQHE